MGGSLFTENRLSNEEYKEYSSQVISILTKHYNRVIIPDSFSEKTDHGDLDVVVDYPIISNKELMALFGLKSDQIYRNTSVISFGYKGFQVDLIHVIKEDYDSLINFSKFGDCSNLLGRIFHKLGYMLSHRGLELPVKLKDEEHLGNILVSKDHEKILEFIGLDSKKWKNGFKNQEEVFEWISNSIYFNPQFFEFEELNHINRTRNRKRKMYAAFVEWCKDKIFTNYYKTPKNKIEQLFRGLLFFGDEWWIDQAKPLIQKRRDDEKIKNTFSGFDVMRITGKSGRDLGYIIQGFKSYIKIKYGYSYDELLLHSSNEEVTRIFNEFKVDYDANF